MEADPRTMAAKQPRGRNRGPAEGFLRRTVVPVGAQNCTQHGKRSTLRASSPLPQRRPAATRRAESLAGHGARPCQPVLGSGRIAFRSSLRLSRHRQLWHSKNMGFAPCVRFAASKLSRPAPKAKNVTSKHGALHPVHQAAPLPGQIPDRSAVPIHALSPRRPIFVGRRDPRIGVAFGARFARVCRMFRSSAVSARPKVKHRHLT